MKAFGEITVRLIVCVLALLLQAGCIRMNAEGVGILPRPASGEIPLSSYRPAHPYKQLAPGLLRRVSYSTENGDLYRAEVWDLLVGPGQRSDVVSLPGAAVFEVRAGSGVISLGDKAQKVGIGSTFALDEGAKFRIENGKTDQAIQIRAYLFIAR